jgi:peptidoglycan/LPS O-acetylase OafA/YrhL
MSDFSDLEEIRSHRFFHGLEYVRFISALLVVFYHFPEYGLVELPYVEDSGFFAVLTFMVLSGIVLEAKSVRRHEDVMGFLKRRFYRLWPLHFVTTLVMIMLVAIDAPQEEGDIQHFLLHFSMLHGTGLEDRGFWNSPSWAISTEFVSSIFLAPVIVMGWKIRHRALILLLCLLLYTASPLDRRISLCICSMILGTLIFKFIDSLAGISYKRVVVLSSFGLLCTLVGYRMLANRTEVYPHRVFLFLEESYLVDLVIISAGLLLITYLNNSLSPTFAFLGKFAYSMYLWHTPLLSLIMLLPGERTPQFLVFQTVLFFIFGIPLCIASYNLIEKPFLSVRQRDKEQ